MVIAFGQVLDSKRWSQRQRAWTAFLCWVIPQCGCFIWIGIEYSKFGQSTTTLDYKLWALLCLYHSTANTFLRQSRRWAEAYLPYLIIFSTGYICQLSLYWILGTFSTDIKSSSRTGGLFRAFETAGQAVSYAINSHPGSDARTPFYVNCAILALAIPSMVGLIRMVPDVPAITDIDAGELPVIVAIAKVDQDTAWLTCVLLIEYLIFESFKFQYILKQAKKEERTWTVRVAFMLACSWLILYQSL